MNILDHGYVNFIESWGSDERIIEAARMSTDKGFQGWGPAKCYLCLGDGQLHDIPTDLHGVRKTIACPTCDGKPHKPGDEKLLRYLWENGHHTPFEMAGMTIEVQAPLFIFREWHRHQSQSYNELSARYTVLPDLYYIPSKDRILAGRQAIGNKQGSDLADWNEAEVNQIQAIMQDSVARSRWAYESLISRGVAREVARTVIPVSQYSRMRASANLRNWLSFLTLRTDSAAQWEIRQFAEAVADLVGSHFPRTFELWKEG